MQIGNDERSSVCSNGNKVIMDFSPLEKKKGKKYEQQMNKCYFLGKQSRMLWLFRILMKTRCYQKQAVQHCLGLLWSAWSLNVSKCSPYVWQLRWPPLPQRCQGGPAPGWAHVRQCCCFPLNECHSSKNPTES